MLEFITDRGVRAIKLYRLSVQLRRYKMSIVANYLLILCKGLTGIEFSSKCKIGKNFKIAHGQNIVIGGYSSIGDNVTIYNGVTLGISGKYYYDKNGELQQKPDYPTIKNNCVVYPGAKILGKIIIEEDTIIGANVVLTTSVKKSMIVKVPKPICRENLL